MSMAVNKVLCVDDDPIQLAAIEKIVSETGYQTVTATNGKEAIRAAKSQKPDIIFMDIVMPEMDGFAACRELVNDHATKGIPVIFVSSKNQKADKMWANMQGAKGYVTKPYSKDQIVEQIQSF
jgi:CheY-like chemotaxis protein